MALFLPICLTHTHTQSPGFWFPVPVSLLHTRIYAHKPSQQHRQTNKLNQKKKISGRSWGSASFLCLLSLSLLSVVMEGGRGGGMFADTKSTNPTQIFLCPRDASHLQRNGRLCLFSATPAQQKEEGTDLKGLALSGCVQVSQVQKKYIWHSAEHSADHHKS